MNVSLLCLPFLAADGFAAGPFDSSALPPPDTEIEELIFYTIQLKITP